MLHRNHINGNRVRNEVRKHREEEKITASYKGINLYYILCVFFLNLFQSLHQCFSMPVSVPVNAQFNNGGGSSNGGGSGDSAGGSSSSAASAVAAVAAAAVSAAGQQQQQQTLQLPSPHPSASNSPRPQSGNG